MHGGGLGSVCYIYSSFSDLVGDEIGQLGWGGWIGHGGTFDFFVSHNIYLCQSLAGRREKIMSDQKKVNATWSL
jgi:hypothetical protein